MYLYVYFAKHKCLRTVPGVTSVTDLDEVVVDDPLLPVSVSTEHST